jgi:hypothetical protein
MDSIGCVQRAKEGTVRKSRETYKLSRNCRKKKE